jgi:transcriptional regulator with XRE-family HTH domain
MVEIQAKLQERYRQVGQVLREARGRKNESVTRCADLISTSRRRYAALENGETIIGVAELELLIDFLEISRDAVWPDWKSDKVAQQFTVQAMPGETVQIVVAIKQ